MFSPSATAARGVSMELNAYVQLLHLLPSLKVISVVGTLPHMGTHPAPAPLSWHDITILTIAKDALTQFFFITLILKMISAWVSTE